MNANGLYVTATVKVTSALIFRATSLALATRESGQVRVIKKVAQQLQAHPPIRDTGWAYGMEAMVQLTRTMEADRVLELAGYRSSRPARAASQSTRHRADASAEEIAHFT
jgi:Zn-dependent M16 (insulinase) family peptidase